MIKAFIIVALVLCINTNEVVEQDLMKQIRPLWKTIQCIINSEKIRTTAKDLFQIIKQRDWMELLEYIPKQYPTLKGEVNRCINRGEVRLGYNLDFRRCLIYYPYPYCAKYLPTDYLDPHYNTTNTTNTTAPGETVIKP